MSESTTCTRASELAREPSFAADATAWLGVTEARILAFRHLVLFIALAALAGLAALILRAELATPGLDLMQARNFGVLLSLHGFLAFYFVAWPALPAIIGQTALASLSPDGRLAFPRLARAAWLLLAAGGLLVLGGFLTGGTEVGWGLEAGFGGRFDQPGLLPVALGVLLATLSMVATGLNTVVTAQLCRRGPGAGQAPILISASLVSGALTLVAAALLAVVMALALADRLFGLSVFAPLGGGDPQKFASLFRVFLAPAVAAMMVLACGLVLQRLAEHNGRAMHARSVAAVLVLLGVAGSLGWGGLSALSAGLSLAGFLLVVVLALQYLRRGVVVVDAALVHGIGFLIMAVQAQGAAWMEAMPAGGAPLATTTFGVARSHLLWLALLGMALPAGLHACWRELTGRTAHDALGRVAALVVFAGSQLAFLPLFVLGLRGASFRANAYPPEFQVLNVLALAGATVLLAGLVLAVLAFTGSPRSRVTRAPLVAACLLLAVLAGAGCGGGAPAEARELRVTVSGMHCEGCAEGITQKLRRQKGVLAVDVHFSNTVQSVRYDARRVDAESLTAIITRAGFTVAPATP